MINAPKPALAGKRKFSCDEQDDNDAFCDGNIVRKLVVRRGPIFGKKPEDPLLLTMESSTCKMNPEAADRKRIRIEGAPLAISAEEEAKNLEDEGGKGGVFNGALCGRGSCLALL